MWVCEWLNKSVTVSLWTTRDEYENSHYVCISDCLSVCVCVCGCVWVGGWVGGCVSISWCVAVVAEGLLDGGGWRWMEADGGGWRRMGRCSGTGGCPWIASFLFLCLLALC